jgi:hypothetical protein
MAALVFGYFYWLFLWHLFEAGLDCQSKFNTKCEYRLIKIGPFYTDFLLTLPSNYLTEGNYTGLQTSSLHYQDLLPTFESQRNHEYSVIS